MSWEFIKLKDIASTSSGGTPNRSKKQFWDNGNIPWIKSGQLKDCIVTNAEEFISEEGLRSSSAKYFKKGTLLLAMYGATAGKLGFLGLDATTNQAICSIIPKSDNLDSKFLYYFLLSIRKEIISDSAGGAQPNIGQNYINELQIPLPPLETQKRIVDILDAADALRQKDQELLKKYDELAQAIFIDMFGDPVKNEKGWDVKTISQIVQSEDNLRIPIESSVRESREGSFPYYGASGIIDYVDNFIFEGQRLLIGEDGANLLARSTPVAFIADGKYWVNNHAHVLNSTNKALLFYLMFWFNSISLVPYITGSAQPKLNGSKLMNIKVPLPNESLIKEFQLIIENLNLSIEKEFKSNSLFHSLLQKAFKGELI